MNMPAESNRPRLVEVELGDRGYPIYIGGGLLSNPGLLGRHIAGRRALVVTNTTVAPLYVDRLAPALDGFEWELTTLPDGERYKTLETCDLVYEKLLERRFDRGTTLIALGGGVVGDITGFIAATYQRGVHFIQVPTTLLAQVDSSVGGKTGVNHRLGKNMIGAFHQPRCVIADTDTLGTLPERELRAGIAEVLKYGLIRDTAFLAYLNENLDALLALDPEVTAFAVERSCVNKAKVVAEDEREGGVRAILNLGHTFGHAIETATGYTEWLHGEAVGCGMVMAAFMSHRMGWLDEGEWQQVDRLVSRAGLPTAPPPGMAPADFRHLMSADKKVAAGRLRLVLLRGLGNAVVTGDFPDQALQETLEYFTSGRTPPISAI